MKRNTDSMLDSPQFLDGSAYLNHVELVRKARREQIPENFWHDPLMYQGCSQFTSATDPIRAKSEDYGIDFEAEVIIVTTDVPMGVNFEEASKCIEYIGLINDVSLRNLIPNELKKGFGFVHGKPPSAISPTVVSPSVLGKYWKDYKVHFPLCVYLNDELFGEPNAGVDMTFNFAQLIVHAAKTRDLVEGTIIGSGTVSNYDRSKGHCCIAEKRMLETLQYNKPQTPWLKFGDVVRIEMLDEYGNNIFGSIEQEVIQI